jgi:uncharacterized membrane protein
MRPRCYERPQLSSMATTALPAGRATGLRARLKPVLRVVLAAAMMVVGTIHFIEPEGFVRIVPEALPAPFALVIASGVFEILGGVGLLVPFTRRFSAWGLIALYVAVFPANVNMAIHHIPLGDAPLPPLLAWLRLPLQAVLIAWAYWYTHPESDRAAP